MERAPRIGLLEAVPWLALVAFAAALALQDIRSSDYWWHLRTGQWIVENGALPRVDPFTYSVAGERWIDIHWLHQLGLYAAHSLGGHAGVVIAKAALVLLLVGLLAAVGGRRERPVVSVVALALALVVASTRFMPRPELPSFVLLAAALGLFERFRHRPDAWIYAVVAVQIVWVNVHGLFALGLALAAIYLGAELLRPLSAPGEGLRIDRVRRLASVAALALAASLANPNGLEGALYPLQQLQMVAPPDQRGLLGSIVSELEPLLGTRGPPAPLWYAAIAVLAAGSLAAMAANFRRLSVSDPLLFAAFGYLALGARRNAALFAIVAATIWVRNWNEARAATPPAPGLRRVLAVAVAALLAAGTIDVVRDGFYPRVGAQRESGLDIVESFHPVDAVDWIAREAPPGPIAHQLSVGGYLLWNLYPEYRAMLDGRLEVYGPERLVEHWLRTPEDLLALDRRYHFGTVLLHYGLVSSDALLGWLNVSPDWRLKFVDDAAAVFVRADFGDPETLREVDVDAPDLFPPLGDERGIGDRRRRTARARFYAALGRNERALEAWEDLLEHHPDEPQGRFRHAALLLAAGERERGARALREAVDDSPDDPELLRAAAVLMRRSGDGAAAQSYETAARRLSRGRDDTGRDGLPRVLSAALPWLAVLAGLAGSAAALLSRRLAARPRRGESAED